MNYTQEEIKELHAINTISEAELSQYGNRNLTEQESAAFSATVEELFEKGFRVSKKNVITLHKAFQMNPRVPVTRQTILDSTSQYRDEYDWKSPVEMEYGWLSAELGQQQTAVVHQLLSNYMLYSRGEEGMKNFNLVVSFAKTQGATITATNYNLIERLRNTPKGTGLEFRPTPDQIRGQKERDAVRNAEPAKKTPFEMAKLRADQVRGLRDPLTGRDLADIEMEKFYEPHPVEQAPAKPAPADNSVNSDNGMWQQRVLDWIASPQIRTNQRAELTEKFGSKPIRGYWWNNYIQMESYLQKQKDEASIQRQLEADRAKMGIRG